MHGFSDRRLSVDARPLPLTAPEEENQVEQRAVSILERTAVFSMTFGPGAALATYTTLFGWYQQTYHSRELLVWMRIALFAPFPLIKLLQQRYDAYFDALYSTRMAYLFRIVIMQLAIASLMVAWMLLPTSYTDSDSELIPIVSFGVILGACAAPFIGSSVQIAVAIDPTLLIYAQLGNTVGMSMPVVAEYAMKFHPDSSHSDLCKVIAVPLTICILVAMWLAALHNAGVFTPAYQVIGDRREAAAAQSSTDVSNPQDDGGSASSAAVPESRDADLEGINSNRQVSESSTSSGTDGNSFPIWVWCWFGMQSLGISADFFMLALIGYFGDPRTTHHLAAFTLLSASVGRILALPFRYLPSFEDGPMHVVGTAFFLARLSLWLSLILNMCKLWNASFIAFTVIWISWNLCASIHNSLTDMTVTSNVAQAKRQVVAQMGLTMNYSALFLGLVVASTIVLSMDESKLSSDIVAS